MQIHGVDRLLYWGGHDEIRPVLCGDAITSLDHNGCIACIIDLNGCNNVARNDPVAADTAANKTFLLFCTVARAKICSHQEGRQARQIPACFEVSSFFTGNI